MKLAQWGVVEGRQLSDRERWLSFWALFAFGFVSIFNVYKLSSVLADLMPIFGFELSNIGMVMTVGSIVGLIVIFPFTWILRKFGIKLTIVVSFVIMMIGTFGTLAFASDSTSFLVFRAIESIGNQACAVAGPQIMVRLFPQKKQGIVMGIWSTWVPIGAIIAFFAVPLLYTAWGWQSLFVFTGILEAIVFVLILLFVKMPAVAENELNPADASDKRLPRKSFLASAVIMAFIFVGYVFCQAGVTNTFYPTYLRTVLGWDTFMGSMPTLVAAAVSIPVSFLAGVLMDRHSCRKWSIVVMYAFMAVMYATFAFNADLGDGSAWAYAVGLGLAAGVVPVAVRTLVPVLAYDPRKVDYALGVMAWVSPLGLLFVSSYGSVVASLGSYHTAALYVLAPLMAVAALIAIFTKSDGKLPEPGEENAAVAGESD